VPASASWRPCLRHTYARVSRLVFLSTTTCPVSILPARSLHHIAATHPRVSLHTPANMPEAAQDGEAGGGQSVLPPAPAWRCDS
jgi:hypothetical protein